MVGNRTIPTKERLMQCPINHESLEDHMALSPVFAVLERPALFPLPETAREALASEKQGRSSVRSLCV